MGDKSPLMLGIALGGLKLVLFEPGLQQVWMGQMVRRKPVEQPRL